MKIINILKLIIWLFCIMVLNNAFAVEKSNIDKPNIVFIMADDLGYGDLGCYGQQILKTPNIDKMGREGTLFTQAYAGGPVCTPSRSVFMTGLHNGHTSARDNIPHYNTYLQENDLAVSEILKKAGYKTGGVGKWSLGDAGTVGRATNKGFDFWLGYLNQDHAHYYYPEYLDYNEDILDLKGNTLLRKFYSHDVLTNSALQFIRDSKEDPFFLYVAYTLPHFSSRSEDVHGLTVPFIDRYSNKDWPDNAKKYATMIDLLDKDVGLIVNLITELGLDDNTLLIFTSDNGGTNAVWNGFKTNGQLRGFKTNLTEGGIRVPFIARWPGKIPAGKSNKEIIAFQDMLPTFAELAGEDIPYNIDGISIVNTLMGKEQKEQHEYLYWDYGHCRKRYDQAVRMDNWKGIRLGLEGKIQLYNLDNDIGETDDLAQMFPQIVEKIEEIMKIAYVPSDYYPIGKKYSGGPIWKK